MQLRFWGGWFLAIAGLAIMLSMGCEKGALGVKPAIVSGRIVKADNDSVGIPGATVRIMSKEALGSSELKMGKNFLTTLTDANGYFAFENVVPDNILVEYSKGANKGTYPSTSTTSQTDTGDTAESAKLTAVYVKSGVVVNLGSLPLAQSEGTLPTNVNIKLDLVNRTTLARIDDVTRFIVTVNGVPLADASANTSLTAGQLRDGIERSSEQTLNIVVRHDSSTILYQTATLPPITVNGEEVYERVELTPVSYNLLLRCVNVPDYITIAQTHVNVYAETPSVGSRPPQVIATHTIENPGAAGTLPALVKIPALSMPVDLRIQVRGYKDEVVSITNNSLAEGDQGNYRLDIDFLYDNSALDGLMNNTPAANSPFQGKFTYDPNVANLSRAGMFNNMLRRDVVLIVAGEDLQTNNWVNGMINLPRNATEFLSFPSDGSAPLIDGRSAPVNSPVEVIFNDVAVGYELFYTVTVSGSASGSFPLSNENGILISPDIDSLGRALAIGVNAKRPAN
ncbi:MAG TPA: hypothetical protein DCG57_18660 [Candidatus Riflebacteria bacterium]|nr:hypothetical protein [Candidatus Riflebacteria bacterium]